MANVRFTWSLPATSPDPIDHFRIDRTTVGSELVGIADAIPATSTSVDVTGEDTGANTYDIVSVSADGDENWASVGLTVVDILPAAVVGASADSI